MGESSEVVDRILGDWVTAAVSGDTSRMMDIYGDEALFFGSWEKLCVGSADIAEYFNSLPDGMVRDVAFSGRQITMPAPGVILVAAFVDFHLIIDGVDEYWPWRIMLTLVQREGRGWVIAGHHAAPRHRR